MKKRERTDWNAKAKSMDRMGKSISKSLRSIVDLFKEFHEIDNAPNGHVTDNSMQFFVEVDNKPPPTDFKFSVPPYKFEP